MTSIIFFAGFLNKLLSWRALVPLSRLTYCAYLMNGLIELYALATVRTGRYMSIYTLVSILFFLILY